MTVWFLIVIQWLLLFAGVVAAEITVRRQVRK
jgi:hypothetical protein